MTTTTTASKALIAVIPRAMVLLLYFSYSFSFGAVEGEDWLPTPDGFVWPQHSTILLSKPKSVPVSDFTASQRKSLAAFIDGIENFESLSIQEADLNGDGVKELFIYQPAYSGTGGTVYEIVTPTTTGFVSIGSVMGGIVLCQPVKGEKWLQIESAGRSGGMRYTRSLLRHTKNRYIETRIEDHDYNLKKVTVRK